jgi:hypothetical protein
VTVRPLDQTQIIVQVPNIVLEGFAIGDGSIPYAEADHDPQSFGVEAQIKGLCGAGGGT